MPRRPVLVLTSLLLVASGLTACSSDSGAKGGSGNDTAGAAGGAGATSSQVPASPSVPASREPGTPAETAALAKVRASGAVATNAAPKVTLGGAISVANTQQRVLSPGTGPKASATSWVVARTVIYNGTTGKQIYSSWQPLAPFDWFGLSQPDMLPGMRRGLIDAQKGSRVVLAIPPKEGLSTMQGGASMGKPTDTLVVVADVKDVRNPRPEPRGTVTQPGGDLPSVGAVTPGDGPSIAVASGKKPPATSTSAVLIPGDGPAVAKGQTLIVNYKGVLWQGGTVFDSSWQRGGQLNFQVGMGKVIPAWDRQLVGKKVGSRVLIVAPPAEAYGAQAQGKIPANSTLVFVVDILDAG